MINIKKRELQRLVKESNSISDIFRSLKMSKCYTNYRQFYELITKYNIDISSLKERAKSANKGKYRKYHINKYLKKDHTNTGRLKLRLIEENIKENKCEICHIDKWNNKHITLQLDHINGDKTDNRLENLRILCPNCHSQTDTYAGKNTKRTRKQYFCECGNNKSRGSIKCANCHRSIHRDHKSNIKKPSKEELLKHLGNMTMIALGQMFNVRDYTVRRWCRGYGLPDTEDLIKEFIKVNKV